MRKIINKKTILTLIIVISILLLIPIVTISFYTHPAADDYNYGINTINKIQNIGVLGVFKGAFDTVVSTYKSWQGTYSAVFLFALSPVVWGDNAYFLTTFIILVALFLGLFYLFKQIILNMLKANKTTLWIILIIFFMLSLETLPCKIQGLYWWNGASYYMLFFALELVEIAILIKRYILDKKTKINYSILIFLILFIAGGNYITALQQVILLALLNIYLLFVKKDKTGLLLFALSILGLGISAISPGNTYRANGVEGMGVVKAILMSFYWGIIYAFKWMTPLNSIIIISIIIWLYPTYKNIKFKFKYPILILVLLICIFSAEFTPTLYAESSTGEGRVWNIMYISYLLFSLFMAYYYVGYIRCNLIDNKIFTKNAYNNFIRIIRKNSLIYIMIFTFFTICYTYPNIKDTTSYEAFRTLKSGEATVYSKEYKERMKILKNNEMTKVEFNAYSFYPSIIAYSDFSDDENSWLNLPATQIYNKESIIVKYSNND